MNLRWGVMPFRLDFEADPEQNIDRTFRCALVPRICSSLIVFPSISNCLQVKHVREPAATAGGLKKPSTLACESHPQTPACCLLSPVCVRAACSSAGT